MNNKKKPTSKANHSINAKPAVPPAADNNTEPDYKAMYKDAFDRLYQYSILHSSFFSKTFSPVKQITITYSNN